MKGQKMNHEGSDDMKPDYTKAVLTYKDTVYRIAFAQCPCRQDAEDVFQDVFLSCTAYNMIEIRQIFSLLRPTERISPSSSAQAQARHITASREYTHMITSLFTPAKTIRKR